MFRAQSDNQRHVPLRVALRVCRTLASEHEWRQVWIRSRAGNLHLGFDPSFKDTLARKGIIKFPSLRKVSKQCTLGICVCLLVSVLLSATTSTGFIGAYSARNGKPHETAGAISFSEHHVLDCARDCGRIGKWILSTSRKHAQMICPDETLYHTQRKTIVSLEKGRSWRKRARERHHRTTLM